MMTSGSEGAALSLEHPVVFINMPAKRRGKIRFFMFTVL